MLQGAEAFGKDRSMMSRHPLKTSLALWFAGVLTSLLLAIAPAARAQGPQGAVLTQDVSNAIARMSKTLTAKEFSFQANTLRAYAGPNGQLLHIVHTAKFVVHRPDRLLVDITGDDGSTKMFYDGKNFVIYGVTRKQYVNIPISGNLDKMLDIAETRLGVDLPLADFLSNDPERSFLNGVTSGGDVGTATIDGTLCRHFYFAQPPDLDVELWLEDNDRALPRRLIVTYISLPGRPSFVAELSNWNFAIHPSDADFVFRPPAGVTKVQLAARRNLSPSPTAK